MGDNCTVGAGAIVQSGVKVWPDKEIEPGATVGESLIWGARGRRTLFTRSGVTGLANVEITPEFGAKLGAVYAALLPKGSSVTVNRDLSRAARMIKRAIISGLPSAGVDVVDIEAVPVPVARYETRTSGATGGIHVRLSPFLAGELDVKLFDWRGFNVDPSTERRIENAFFREDFRRVPLAEIGRIVEAVGVLERYSASFLERVDGESLRRAGLHVVVDFAEGSSSHLFAGLLERLGVRRVVLNAATGERLGVRTLAQYQGDLAQLSTITTTVRANLGLTLNNDATRFTLVDERGQVIPDFTALAAFAVLCLRAHRGGTIAVPVQAPSILDEVVSKHGGRLIRTKHNTSALMAAAGEGVCLIGDGHGGIHFPELESGFDAMLAVTKLLGYLSAEKVALSEVVAELPPYILVERDVPCPWDDKGRVMRALNDQASTSAAAQIDGVRFEGEGEWALVLPDPDHPTFQIFAEAESRERADALVDRYADLVASLRG
ncbi:MAG: hypothetical protein HY329_26410 [Chloroflexi bacterium]|nr:hypothetical protein [Chloroflexota bacterium]